MEPAQASFIQQIIAPATLIPACGLLLLSSTARMNTVLARIRAFHSERLNIWQQDAKPGSRASTVRTIRLEGLEHQTHRLLRRAKLLRITMLQLFAAISCNILAMLALAANVAGDAPSESLRFGAAAVFVLGLLCMAGSMITSVLEVLKITETVIYEHARVESLQDTDPDSACEDLPPMSTRSGEGTAL